MAYADDTASFVKAIKVVKDDIASSTTFQTNATALQNDLDTLSSGGVASVAAALTARRDAHAALQAQGRAFVEPTLVQIGKTINSSAVNGDRIIDRAQFWRDWRYYQEVTADEKVTSRAVTYAAEPAAAATGILRRLTKGPNGTNETIEAGRHAKTVTGTIEAKPAAFRSVIRLSNLDDGPIDALDYLAASPRTVDIYACNENDPGSGVDNATLRANSGTNGASITSYSNWTLTNTTTLTVLTSIVWRSLANVTKTIGITGSVKTMTVTQKVPTAVLTDPYKPWLPMTPLYMEASWAGDITITWGSKSQAFTEADLSAGAWVQLMVDRDADLYPVNFDQAACAWTLAIAHDDVATPKYVLCGGFYAAEGVKFENVWYFHLSHSSEPALKATLAFADTSTAAGIIQDRLSFLWGDSDEGAYLQTGGTNTLADP